MKEGFILIDKPKNLTSHDVVDEMRRITGIKKIGHAGTLDPFATGLLILGIGRKATKKLYQFLKMEKEYIGKIKLGATSDTYDKEGKIEERKINQIPEKTKVEKVLKNFEGEILQIPPLYSAKKIKGKKLYQLARKKIPVKVEPKRVKIYKIKILNYKFPYLTIKVNCSAGTYIRTLAHDIGEELNCGAYLEELRRTKIGNFSIKEAKRLSDVNSENWKNFLIKI
ncbi:tRNA pseudouridine(55) synthase TruB [bacterium]|nr:tRNA pseudouridine(55) synthase TruB [bacterium]